jgi:hypothetical protein
MDSAFGFANMLKIVIFQALVELIPKISNAVGITTSSRRLLAESSSSGAISFKVMLIFFGLFQLVSAVVLYFVFNDYYPSILEL